MPATRTAYRTTDAYRRQLLATRGHVNTLVARAWYTQVSGADLDSELDRFGGTFATVTEAGQRHAVALTAAYLATYLAASLGGHQPPVGLNPDGYVGRTESGLTLLDLTGGLGPLLKKAIGDGQPLDTVLTSGVDRLQRIAGSEVMRAGRDALTDGVAAEPRIVGWQRVTSGQCCDFCEMLAGRGPVYHSEDSAGFDVHPGCGCTAEPILGDVPDRYPRTVPADAPTVSELDPSEADKADG